MNGKLYCVGVGSGDPALLTQKAVHVLREADVIACPVSGDGIMTALEVVKHLTSGKEILSCPMPMTHDQQELNKCHEHAAGQIRNLVQAGRIVAYITLGDPAIYSTYWYIDRYLRSAGIIAEIVPGVPSFCAAAAAAGVSLCEGGEPLHILPANHVTGEMPRGNKVLMKAGREMLAVRDMLQARGEIANAVLVSRCGMEGETIVRDISTLTEPPGYFSVVLIRRDSQ